MIGGNPNEFLDRIYSCQDTIFSYRGITYWFQGYMPNENTVHMEITQYLPPSERYVWEYDGTTIEECQQAFLEVPLFEGKMFWEAEQEIDWLDG